MAVTYIVATPGYFKTMRIPVVEGREFQTGDTRQSFDAVIVNETMAKRFWPGVSPLGRRLRHWGDRSFIVVGVAKDGKYYSLEELPQPFMYLSLDQVYQDSMILHLRSNIDSPALLVAIQKVIHDLDPGVSVVRAMRLVGHMDAYYYAQRILATLLASLGILALLLACLGIYGVLNWSVSRRLNEISIRMSLGASPGAILKMVVLDGTWPMLAGVVVGLLSAAFLSHYLAAYLVGVQPHDPLIHVSVCGILVLIGLMACYIPARRAASVDPKALLGSE